MANKTYFDFNTMEQALDFQDTFLKHIGSANYVTKYHVGIIYKALTNNETPLINEKDSHVTGWIQANSDLSFQPNTGFWRVYLQDPIDILDLVLSLN
jgi:hypothetical protein